MKGRPCKPAPADFAEHCGDTLDSLAARYGVSNYPVRSWITQQSAEWQERHRGISNARRATAARANVLKAHIAALSRPKRYKSRPARPAPYSLLDDLMAMSMRAVGEKHGCSRDTVERWRELLPSAQRREIKAARDADNVALLGNMRAKSTIVRMENARKARAERPAPIPKAPRAPKPRRNAPVNWGFHKPTMSPDLPGGIAQRAVDFLKRHYAPAFNAERVYGKSWEGMFVVGRERLDAAATIEKARALGFNPDGWRALAA